MSKKKLGKNEKLQDIARENNQQYCKVCHHTLQFYPREKIKHCSWCGAVNKNKTRASFNYNFYKAKNEKYKTIKLEEK